MPKFPGFPCGKDLLHNRIRRSNGLLWPVRRSDDEPVCPEPFDDENNYRNYQVFELVGEEVTVQPDQGAEQDSGVAERLDAVIDHGDIDNCERGFGEIKPEEEKLDSEEHDVHEDEGRPVVVGVIESAAFHISVPPEIL